MNGSKKQVPYLSIHPVVEYEKCISVFLQQINDYKFIDSEISPPFFFTFCLFEKILEDIGFFISDFSKSDHSKSKFPVNFEKTDLREE